MEGPVELNTLALLSERAALIPSHGPQCEVLMSTERSQVSWTCARPCHKDNGWVCAGTKLKRTQQ